jgi:hypothetical protein
VASDRSEDLPAISVNSARKDFDQPARRPTDRVFDSGIGGVRKVESGTGDVSPTTRRCSIAPSHELFVIRLTGCLTLKLEGYEK